MWRKEVCLRKTVFASNTLLETVKYSNPSILSRAISGGLEDETIAEEFGLIGVYGQQVDPKTSIFKDLGAVKQDTDSKGFAFQIDRGVPPIRILNLVKVGSAKLVTS
jgi:hypothetical protein